MVTKAQQRSLAAGLRIIELELAWTEVLLAWTYHGVTLSFDDDLSDPVRHGLQTGIGEARKLIQELRDTLELPLERISKSRWVGGHFATLWVAAEECQSRYLRGYGEVGPDIPAVIDPLARRLVEILVRLAAEVRDAAESQKKEGA